MGKRGPKPLARISPTWTRELAYAVGLITTDGCLSKDGRHIDFTSKNKDLVETFRTCLGISNRIGMKISGYTGRKEYYRVQFGDVSFYNWLLELGLTPHKSRTLPALAIPDEFFFDFLRGSFDGDGTIYAFWDPRWHSSYMYYLKFTSASRAHLLWLQERIETLCKAQGKIKPGLRCSELVFAKRATRCIFQKMFSSQELPHLERKLLKAQKIFAIDKTS